MYQEFVHHTSISNMVDKIDEATPIDTTHIEATPTGNTTIRGCIDVVSLCMDPTDSTTSDSVNAQYGIDAVSHYPDNAPIIDDKIRKGEHIIKLAQTGTGHINLAQCWTTVYSWRFKKQESMPKRRTTLAEKFPGQIENTRQQSLGWCRTNEVKVRECAK